MTAVFREKERSEAFRTKKRLLTFWFIALGLYVAAVVVMVTLNIVDIYTSRSRRFYVPFAATTIALSVVFACGSLFFFQIKYRLTSRYCRMLREMKEGLKDRSHGKFISIDPEIVEKDGVYFYKLILDCPPMKRGDITERDILIERTHSIPEMFPGDEMRFITHANILVAYEITRAADITPGEAEEYEADETVSELPEEITEENPAGNPEEITAEKNAKLTAESDEKIKNVQEKPDGNSDDISDNIIDNAGEETAGEESENTMKVSEEENEKGKTEKITRGKE